MSSMAQTKSLPIAATFTCLVVTSLLLVHPIDAQVGVCYGRYLGDNLPSVRDVVNLYRSKGIRAMRIYGPDEEVLRAVRGTGIKLIVNIPNGDDIIYIGANPKEATRFVRRYVVPYAASIKYIAVGNEIPMNSPYAPLVGPAIQNVINALNAVRLGGRIKVSTAISTTFVKNTYPPSNGEFTNLDFIRPIVEILAKYDSPLMVNIYTFFAYSDPSNTGQISLDYALFRSRDPVFTDWNNGLQYYNLFDAMVDSVYAALSKVTVKSVNGTSKRNVRVMGSETGWSSHDKWPTDGRVIPDRIGAEGAATIENAEAYYKNLINHVKQGTPLRPEPIEVFLFEMFDENRKPGDEVERHFGLFYPNMQPKYQINFRPAIDVM